MLKNTFNCLCLIALLNFAVAFTASNAKDKAIAPKDLCLPDSTQIQILYLKDGSTFNGRIIEIREREILFDSGYGLLTIPLNEIDKISLVLSKAMVGGKYWFPNPNQTRLFFAPTGRMLKRGEGYFSDYYLFFPGIAVGLTDNITLGGGMSIFPGLSLDEQLFFFTPKIGLKAVENINFATGALIISIPTDDDEDISPIGILYGVGTFGSPITSLTFGLGYGFAGDELADSPIVMLGGEARLFRRVSLVSENWFIPGLDRPLISYGFRFMGEALSVDLALAGVFDDNEFFFLPYLDFVYNF